MFFDGKFTYQSVFMIDNDKKSYIPTLALIYTDFHQFVCHEYQQIM
jgi:hypothetical protein